MAFHARWSAACQDQNETPWAPAAWPKRMNFQISSGGGTPARPLKEHLEMLANLSRLPEMRKEMREMKRKLAVLEGKT